MAVKILIIYQRTLIPNLSLSISKLYKYTGLIAGINLSLTNQIGLILKLIKTFASQFARYVFL